MKRLMIAATCAGLMLMAVPAAAQTVRLAANLDGGQEAPNKVTTGAFGTATVTVDVAAGTITYSIQIFNIPSGLTAGHIHVGAEGVAGPTMFTFPTTPNTSNDFSLSGTFTSANLNLRLDQGIRSFEDAIQALVGGNTYVNFHTVVNPGGEVRGQLKVQQR